MDTIQKLEKKQKVSMEGKINKNNFFEVSINKMFEIAKIDLCYNDVLSSHDWYIDNTWNEEQENEFKKWFIINFSKAFKAPKYKGKRSGTKQFDLFNMQYGLKRNDYETIS